MKKQTSRPAARSRVSSRVRSEGGKTGPARKSNAQAELIELRSRLREAEETLEAILSGGVDAVVVNGTRGSQVYSMTGAEQPYRVYVEQMQEGAVTVSAGAIVLYCNQRFANMLEQPLEKVIGSSLADYVPAATWTALSKVFRQPGSSLSHVSTLRYPRQTERPVNLTASHLSLEGPALMCLVVTDLSGQKQMEEFRLAKELAEKASSAKDSFLAALSHELRTPLTPVLMVSAALEKDPALPEKTRDDISIIRRNVELEARLIDDLLDLTRISHGKLNLHRQDLDLHTVLGQAIEICSGDALAKNQTFQVQLNASRTNVRGDAVRIQQAMWNVIRNAVKFSPAGSVIEISTENPTAGRIFVHVTDRGIGFSSGTNGHLFEAFEQGGRHIPRQFGGLGLGLAISRSIMTAHDGDIRAESPGLNQGATFTLEFRVTVPPQLNPSQDPFPKSATAPTTGLNILLVEDHKDTRQSIQRLLEMARHKVTPAGSAGEALGVADQDKFDLVISDLGLPDQTGHELMAQLQTRHGLSGIALSGYGMEEDIERSRQAGFRYHLTKPVSFDRLKELIKQFPPK